MHEQNSLQRVTPQARSTEFYRASMEGGRTVAQVMSKIIGRVGGNALDRILEKRGALFDDFKLVWVCGAAAAGKSTAMRCLQTFYPDIPVIHDRHALVEAIQEASSLPSAKSLPTVVDKNILCTAFHRVANQAKSSAVALIELGRGLSASAESHTFAGEDPMSLSFALRALTPDTLARSLFLYLTAPIEDRMVRNLKRPLNAGIQQEMIPDVRCSDETMLTVFKEIDAESLLSRKDLHFIEMKNIVEKEDFHDVLEFLFGGRP